MAVKLGNRRTSYIYVMNVIGEPSRAVKVGRSVNPVRRLNELQTANHRHLEFQSSYPVASSDAVMAERLCHEALSPIHLRGEYFRASISLVNHVARWVSENLSYDDFIMLYVQYELAFNEYVDHELTKLNKGRWNTQADWDKYELLKTKVHDLRKSIVDMDQVRFYAADPYERAISSL